MSANVTDDPAADRPAFALDGPLPTGTTVLEASAGTGKTYAIAALAARYVAEGVATLDQLLLVTFGRMATSELRVRVRERLVSLHTHLASPSPAADRELDDVERLLLTGRPDELAVRRRRLAAALAEFDAATIATTHEFCLAMLDGLGVLGDRDSQAQVVEQVSELTREAATDLYLQRYAPSGSAPMPYEEALRVAERAVDAVHARLVPTAGPNPAGADAAAPHSAGAGVAAPHSAGAGTSAATERTAYAEAVRREVDRRKRVGRLFTYDDMLTRLRDALTDPGFGEAAARRLRDRYQVVMVDEFQDTDPIQWEIVRRAFAGHRTLILIGDPKQAIYAFRGADVHSYLDAVREADQVATLATNWRSDAALLDALDGLFGGVALGSADIVVRPVTAHHRERRLTTPEAATTAAHLAAPFRLRVLPAPEAPDRVPSVASVRPQIVADLVADVTTVLGRGLQLTDRGETRPLRPADLAVLVRRNERGEAIRDALVQAGVPAVLPGVSSVYSSPVAEDWLTLLAALEQPRQPLVRRAALTCFFGWSFPDVATAGDAALTDLIARVRRWGRLLASRGVAALVETAMRETGVAERLLGVVGGERLLTDLRHLGQSLHAAMTGGQLGVSALLEWLREQVAEAAGHPLSDGARRLETDADAVTILTVHRSKGLEFPVVYLPDVWDRHVPGKDDGAVLRLHEDETDTDRAGACLLDVGGRWSPGRADRLARHQTEEAGEDLRLGYVALTRARCQVVAWWAPTRNTSASALHRLLQRGPEGAPAPGYPLAGDPVATAPRDLAGLQVEPVAPRPPATWQPTRAAEPDLAVRTLDRVVDLEWRRTSYSALTARVHEPGSGTSPAGPMVGSEPEGVRDDDEPVADELDQTTGPDAAGPDAAGPDAAGRDPGRAAWDRVSPMAALPSGPQFGTAVHTVLEAVDPAAPDLPAAVRRACRTALAAASTGPLTADELAAGLLPAFVTPLGPLAGDRRLVDVSPADRRSELGFELPLAGADDRPAATLADLAGLLRRHLAAPDPLAGYADRLDQPGLADQVLRGYLTGSIDAVLRVRDQGQPPRYLVVDYKTNLLGAPESGPATLRRYAPDRLGEAMMHAHYPLQALLYAVAVHRLLRWRQPGYDPAVHLGGVLYLFVRGMAGPDTPRVDQVPAGVFSWRPPADLVVAISDLLDGSPGLLGRGAR